MKPAFDRFGDSLGVVVSAIVLPAALASVDRFGLTERETEVLHYLASGYSITHIYQKTGAQNRIDLVNMIGTGGQTAAAADGGPRDYSMNVTPTGYS